MSEPIHLPELNDSLKEKLLKWLPDQSRLETPIPGLALTRHDENTSAIRCFYTPMIALVVQGFKRSMIGDHEANYGELHCVTVGIDMPGVFHITDASPQAPFLSLSVKLDRRIITQLITEVPSIVTAQEGEVTPIVVDEAGKDLLQVFSRLVELLDTPSRIPVLAPMIIREIHYYLLCGSQGKCLRLFNTNGTQANQIAQAISWLRENRHFKEVTSLSPLQFQKRLRLYEAERLMLLEGKDAGTAALMVGYESGSQFNREYKRQFGAPPRKDIAKKRS